jgi:hypothetical protein
VFSGHANEEELRLALERLRAMLNGDDLALLHREMEAFRQRHERGG